MQTLFGSFMLIPFNVRVILVLLIIFTTYRFLLGNFIKMLLSLIPHAIIKLLKLIYITLEYPVSAFNHKFGGVFYTFDKNISAGFGTIDAILGKIVVVLRSTKKIKKSYFVTIYMLVILAIIVPRQYNSDNKFLNFPNRYYSYFESSIDKLLLESDQTHNGDNEDTYNKRENITQPTSLITFRVNGTTNALNVRDIPSTLNCKILDNVANGGFVSWYGDLTFGKNDKGVSEPWVKIVTNNGIEGWARLSFLIPENNEELKLTVIKKH